MTSRPTADVAYGTRWGLLAGESARSSAGVELGGAPAVPGDDAAVRPVRVTQRLEFLGCRRRYPPGEAEALTGEMIDT